ncbi:MAG: hypothetical protein ING84_04825 [Cytophagales bacterium]|nr:hypothetical protein [Cytophagales bacterium]MCA6367195.1 hypothetical protein [Cytophagales bacterium]MCA6370737.1 hypothetical protein [Cytophagales bacterium]MCA6374190.1 hypothetical protein [Cytophagales bacterium]MCA6381917.1 hypothetical protein [Cytophagales bacterium]
MKNLFVVFFISLSLFSLDTKAQEMKVVTIVESIVPGGLGRSRIIEAKEVLDAKTLTTTRVDGKKSDQDDIKRSDAKIENFEETKLLNFYSLVGINFQNIASNDAAITSKINDMLKDGWQLQFVTSGVESDAGKSDGNGIFITRLYFKK